MHFQTHVKKRKNLKKKKKKNKGMGLKSNRKPCVVANWKMHASLAMIKQWVLGWKENSTILSDRLDIVICPPFVYLQDLLVQIPPFLAVGAQNVYCEEQGAYTGEVSPGMLKDIGCPYVIVGHSERRTLFSESNALVAKKFKIAYDDGLIPILCVGETRAEREAGNTLSVIRLQLEAIFSVVHLSCFKRALIAYEPVWAIGTGLTATPEQAEEVHFAIRQVVDAVDPLVALEVRLLYGGSVKTSNARELFSQPNIDGGLIGGASLEVNEFFNICQCVS